MTLFSRMLVQNQARMIDYEQRQNLLAEANKHMSEKRPAGAIALLEPYVEEHGGDYEARALLGNAYLANGMFFNAESQYRESLAINSDQHELKKVMLRMQMDLKRWEEALELAQEIVKEDPNDKVSIVMLESCKENVERPEIGWERDAKRDDIVIDFSQD